MSLRCLPSLCLQARQTRQEELEELVWFHSVCLGSLHYLSSGGLGRQIVMSVLCAESCAFVTVLICTAVIMCVQMLRRRSHQWCGRHRDHPIGVPEGRHDYLSTGAARLEG